jgi:hypothetical protein
LHKNDKRVSISACDISRICLWRRAWELGADTTARKMRSTPMINKDDSDCLLSRLRFLVADPSREEEVLLESLDSSGRTSTLPLRDIKRAYSSKTLRLQLEITNLRTWTRLNSGTSGTFRKHNSTKSNWWDLSSVGISSGHSWTDA